MKQLAIDWIELSAAFDNSFSEMSYYLDTETGRVLMVMYEDQRHLEQIYQDYFDPGNPDAFDIEAVLLQVELQDWQQEGIRTADFINQHHGPRVVYIQTNQNRRVDCDRINPDSTCLQTPP